MMSFSEAVQICLTKKYKTMSGRATRAEFWWFQLFILLTDTAIMLLALPFGKEGENVFFIICMIFNLCTFIPYLCVFVRRLHDRGISGSVFWWALLISIWGIFLICWIINMFPSKPGANEFGPNPLDTKEKTPREDCQKDQNSPAEHSEYYETTDVYL